MRRRKLRTGFSMVPDSNKRTFKIYIFLLLQQKTCYLSRVSDPICVQKQVFKQKGNKSPANSFGIMTFYDE